MRDKIRHILKEETQIVKMVDHLVNTLEPPYFWNLRDYMLSEEEEKQVMSKILGRKVEITHDDPSLVDRRDAVYVRTKIGRLGLYGETQHMSYDAPYSWSLREWDENNNRTLWMSHKGEWVKTKYDPSLSGIDHTSDEDKIIYKETSKDGVIVDKRDQLTESMRWDEMSDHFNLKDPKQLKFFEVISKNIINSIEKKSKQGGTSFDIFLNYSDPQKPLDGFQIIPSPFDKRYKFDTYDRFRHAMGGYTNYFSVVLMNLAGVDGITSMYIVEKYILPKLWEKFYSPNLEK